MVAAELFSQLAKQRQSIYLIGLVCVGGYLKKCYLPHYLLFKMHLLFYQLTYFVSGRWIRLREHLPITIITNYALLYLSH